MLLLAAIALIAIGPKQLPEVARVLARFINDMKRVRDEFTRSIVEHRDQTDEAFYNQTPHVPHFPEAPPVAEAQPVVSETTPIQTWHPPSLEAHTESQPPAVDEADQMAFDLNKKDS